MDTFFTFWATQDKKTTIGLKMAIRLKIAPTFSATESGQNNFIRTWNLCYILSQTRSFQIIQKKENIRVSSKSKFLKLSQKTIFSKIWVLKTHFFQLIFFSVYLKTNILTHFCKKMSFKKYEFLSIFFKKRNLGLSHFLQCSNKVVCCAASCNLTHKLVLHQSML